LVTTRLYGAVPVVHDPVIVVAAVMFVVKFRAVPPGVSSVNEFASGTVFTTYTVFVAAPVPPVRAVKITGFPTVRP